VPLTVHDYSRKTSLYVNFAQAVTHNHISTRLSPPKRMSGQTMQTIHLRPPLHTPLFPLNTRSCWDLTGPANVWTMRLHWGLASGTC